MQYILSRILDYSTVNATFSRSCGTARAVSTGYAKSVAAERPGCISGVRKDGSIEARQCILKSWNANMVVELDLLSFRPEDHVESKPPQNTIDFSPPQSMTYACRKLHFSYV